MKPEADALALPTFPQPDSGLAGLGLLTLCAHICFLTLLLVFGGFLLSFVVQRSESVLYIHISSPSGTSLLPLLTLFKVVLFLYLLSNFSVLINFCRESPAKTVVFFYLSVKILLLYFNMGILALRQRNEYVSSRHLRWENGGIVFGEVRLLRERPQHIGRTLD